MSSSEVHLDAEVAMTTAPGSSGARRPPGLREVGSASGLQSAIEVLGDRPEGCLVCDAPAPRKLFQRHGKWHWQCRDCSLVFIHDIYPEFLSEEDPEVVIDTVLANTPRGTEVAKWHVTLVEFEGYRRTGRLLDLGCAQGSFLGQVQRAGWQEQGVETVPVLAEHCREKLGLNVFSGDLISAAFPEGHFDGVHMGEVIEHVVDPVELLTEVHRVLRPGGLALFRTGNVDSWSARLRRSEWPYFLFHPGGHIRFFGPQATRALGRAAGFTDVTTSTRGFAFREGGELRGRWYRLPVKIAQAPISAVAGLLGAGHRLTMRFRK